MPEFKNLDKDYVICSHAFINTLIFQKMKESGLIFQ